MTDRSQDSGRADGLTHLSARGNARMVDVGAKSPSRRLALASGSVRMHPETRQKILAGGIAKGEVLQVARLAGIMAAKRTGEWIPLCHPLGLDSVAVDFQFPGEDRIEIFARATTTGKTGVEMEALTAVSAAGLTIYDMAKAIDKAMQIDAVRLRVKTGGKSDICDLNGTLESEASPGSLDTLYFAPRPEGEDRHFVRLLGVPGDFLEPGWQIEWGEALYLVTRPGEARREGPAPLPGEAPDQRFQVRV